MDEVQIAFLKFKLALGVILLLAMVRLIIWVSKTQFIKKNKEKITSFINKNILKIFVPVSILGPFLMIPIVIWILNKLVIICDIFGINPVFFIDLHDKTFTLEQMIYWYVYYIGVLITLVFSYMLWKTGEKSNKLAKAINDKEENKEKEKVRETALIVHYNIIHAFDIITQLYFELPNKVKNDNSSIEHRKILLNKNWMKDLVLFRKHLLKEDLDLLFFIFEQMETLQTEIGEKFDKEKIKFSIEKIFEVCFLFNKDYILAFLSKTKHPKKLFVKRLREVLEVIESLTYLPSEFLQKEDKDLYLRKKVMNLKYGEKEYTGELKDDLFEGLGRYKAQEKGWNGLLFSTERWGNFNKGRLESGIRVEYYDCGKIWFKYELFDKEESDEYTISIYFENDSDTREKEPRWYQGKIKDKKLYEGKGCLFDKDGNKIYEGSIVNCMKEGEGKEYSIDGDIVFKGTFKKGQKYNGKGQEITSGGYINGIIEKGKMIEGTYFSNDGMLEIEYDKNQVQIKGRGIQYHNNSDKNIWYEGAFRGKDWFGRGKEYYSDGKLKYEGEFEHGKYSGYGKWYSQNGKVELEGNFDNGNLKRGTVYFEHNWPFKDEWFSEKHLSYYYEGNIEKGIPQGEGRVYDDNGNLHFEGTFYNGRLHSGFFHKKDLYNILKEFEENRRIVKFKIDY